MQNIIQLFFQKSGLQTSLQDLGRWGQQHLGIPIGGAMDVEAATTANWLVGNTSNNPVLEITLMGPTIELEGVAQIALTGANLSPIINGKKAPMYKTIALNGKTTLEFGKPRKGCRTYLAVGGSWQVPLWLSSCSPILAGSNALLPQSRICAQDRIFVHPKEFIDQRSVPKKLRPMLPHHVELRAFAGPEFECFSRTSIAAFFSHKHVISNDSNRMGYRLETLLPAFHSEGELISSGIVPGTIQVSHAGQPIILMKDAPTTGGYYRIATIHSADLDQLAQLKPQDSVSFRLEVE